MKKWVLWILILSMAITFLGIVILEMTYIRQTSNILRSQLESNSKQALYQVSRTLEEREVKRYVEQEMNETTNDLLKAESIIKGTDNRNILPNVNIDTTYNSIDIHPHKNTSIVETNRIYNERYKQRFLRSRILLDQVTLKLVHEAPLKSINERINYDELKRILDQELKNNEIDIPYHFSITDKDNNIIYSCHDDRLAVPKLSISQQLFTSEKGTKTYYLNLFYPSLNEYMMSIMKLVLPTSVLTIMLFLTFFATIYYIFRQRRLNEIKTDFMNNMTHEFKTPISSISLASQMLRDEAVTKSPVMLKHISQVIVDETKRLSFQVDKVLQMSLFEREKANMKLGEVEINEMLQNITDNFSIKIKSKGGRIISSLKATNSLAMVDEMHFTNVIYNLMDNALKYSKETLILTVSSWNDKGKLFISIEDNGIGIAKEDQKRVFEKFYRVHTGNLHDVKGFGLGLAYVKKIVEDHMGTISIESELGIGTKFIIELPTLNNF